MSIIESLNVDDVKHLYAMLHRIYPDFKAAQYPLEILEDGDDDDDVLTIGDDQPRWRHIRPLSVGDEDDIIVGRAGRVERDAGKIILEHVSGEFHVEAEMLGEGSFGSAHSLKFHEGLHGGDHSGGVEVVMKVQDIDRTITDEEWNVKYDEYGFPLVERENPRIMEGESEDGRKFVVVRPWVCELIALFLQRRAGITCVPNVYCTLVIEDKKDRVRKSLVLMDKVKGTSVYNWIKEKGKSIKESQIEELVYSAMDYMTDVRSKLDMVNFDMHVENVMVDPETGRPFFIDPAMTIFTDPETQTTYVRGYDPVPFESFDATDVAERPDILLFWMYIASYYEYSMSTNIDKGFLDDLTGKVHDAVNKLSAEPRDIKRPFRMYIKHNGRGIEKIGASSYNNMLEHTLLWLMKVTGNAPTEEAVRGYSLRDIFGNKYLFRVHEQNPVKVSLALCATISDSGELGVITYVATEPRGV